MTHTIDMQRATDFIWRTARLIDRHRFAYLFADGGRDAALAALRPYQNADGGFGNALEPDFRGPVSQPASVLSAFEIVDEVDGFTDPMVSRVCAYLTTVTGPDGGVPFVLPTVHAYPRAPWWEPEDGLPGATLPTAGIAALLYQWEIDHPWLHGATAFCWQRIDALESARFYDIRSILSFLDRVPDRARAEQAFARISPMIHALVTLDPDAPGEIHPPLDFAPQPDTLARRLFSDAVIETHLDALAAAQHNDGGWSFNWLDWNPATTLEWRGMMTIQALKTLRAYGRVS